MEPPSLLLALLGLGALVLNAFFTMCVSALSALPKDSPEPSKILYLASAQLGQSFSTLSFAFLTIPVLERGLSKLMPWPPSFLLKGISFGLSFLLLTLIFATFRQSVKAYAENDPASVLLRLNPLLGTWHKVIYPLTNLTVQLYKLGFKVFGVQEKGTVSQSEKLRYFFSSHSNLDKHEQELFRNVIDFSETLAKEMMVPRPDVVWISSEDTLSEALQKMKESGHTRFPLCEANPDSVIGYLHVKDLVFAEDKASDLHLLKREVTFVPETAEATTLLQKLQGEQSHFAVVVDEFGGMAGILTLEDLLEELVGEIRDEFDEDEVPEITELVTGELIVNGGTQLEDLEETYGLDFGEVEEDTVGGYIFGRLVRAARIGETLEIKEACLKVEAVSGLRITQVRIIPTKKLAEPLRLTPPTALSPTVQANDFQSEFPSESN